MSDIQPGGQFPDTQWSLVSLIQSPDPAVAARALNDLCAQYHYPLYCYIRRRGLAHHDAQDLLHDFLGDLCRLRAFERVTEEKGRLRGYFCTSLGRRITDWREGETRRVRTDGEPRCLLEAEAEATRYALEHFADTDTPERIFERAWARQVITGVVDKLAERYARSGRDALFRTLRPALLDGGSLRGADTPALATQLGMSQAALRTALHRLMGDFRKYLESAVRLTVEKTAHVEAEIAYLGSVFGA